MPYFLRIPFALINSLSLSLFSLFSFFALQNVEAWVTNVFALEDCLPCFVELLTCLHKAPEDTRLAR